MTTPTDFQRLLGWLDGDEDKTQTVEVPPQVLAEAHRLLREIARDFLTLAPIAELSDRITDEQAAWVYAACNRWRLSE